MFQQTAAVSVNSSMNLTCKHLNSLMFYINVTLAHVSADCCCISVQFYESHL